MSINELPLTIFTPAYNRNDMLKRLYSSLCAQSDLRFEWVVVDDGSTDETRKTVSEWMGKTPFPLRYIYQENAGKHVAHNRGATEARGRLFLCVDSDDWLEQNAVETILADAPALGAEESLLYPKLFSSQNALGKWFPEGLEKIELSDMRMKYGLAIETAIVFRTKILRRHPFPVIEGERFMPEGSAYYDFRNPELFLVRNATFYRCEYLDEGLTRKIWQNWLNNPVGVRLALAKRYSAAKRYSGMLALREKAAAIAGIESLNLALGKALFEGVPVTPLRILALPIAVYLRSARYQNDYSSRPDIPLVS